jgi:peptide/nickel transport system substrate-binding protein
MRYVATHYQPRFTPQLADLRRVRATSRLTVRIDLRHPSIGFDDQPLADLPIIPRHRWQGLPAGQLAPSGPAVGSGPYRLVSARRRQGYVLRANRGYFRGAPAVREIRVPIIGDAERSYEALRDRTVDMVPLSLPAASAANVGSTLGVALKRGPSYVGTALVLNVRRAPFDSRAARRGVAAALDLGRIARAVAPAVAADEGFVHPASRWSGGTTLQRFEPLAAAPALARLGGRNLRVLAADNDPTRLEAGRQVVLALRRAGVRATLVKLSRRRLDRATGTRGGRATFDAAIQSIPALASFDPDYLTRLFGSDPRAAPLNVGGYRSPAFDAAARRVASAAGVAARRRAASAELALLASEVPAIPLVFSTGTFAYRAAVYDGWVFMKGNGILDKRSFLASAAAAPDDPPAAGVIAEPPDPGSGLSPVNVLSIVVLLVVAGLAAAALLARRRERRR